MKAISLWQPWATLWLLEGEKRFETRSWYTSHRGPLLIHAAKKQDGDVREFLRATGVRRALERHGLKVEDLQYGYMIGEVRLIGCCRTDQVPSKLLTDAELSFGNWEAGRYAWERASNPTLFPNPVRVNGRQGLFNVEGWNQIPARPDDLIAETAR